MGKDKNRCDFTDFYEVAEKFGNIFGIRLIHFVDQTRSALVFGYVVIDIIKFDKWLHKKHGNYEKQGMSMKDCIIKFYGKEGDEIISNMIL